MLERQNLIHRIEIDELNVSIERLKEELKA